MVFIIDREFERAALWMFVSSVLSMLGHKSNRLDLFFLTCSHIVIYSLEASYMATMIISSSMVATGKVSSTNSASW